MEEAISSVMKKFSRYESEISSILGMLVVGALALFIFLFFKHVLPKPSILPAAQMTQQASTTTPTPSAHYVVKQGQGLWQISQDLYHDGHKWTAIAKANNLKAPYVIRRGQSLIIPAQEAAVVTQTSKEVVASATPVAMKAQVTLPPTTMTTTTTSATHVIVAGDSLWKIAVDRYNNGYKWVQIYKQNRKLIGSNPGKLNVGTTLELPAL